MNVKLGPRSEFLGRRNSWCILFFNIQIIFQVIRRHSLCSKIFRYNASAPECVRKCRNKHHVFKSALVNDCEDTRVS